AKLSRDGEDEIYWASRFAAIGVLKQLALACPHAQKELEALLNDDNPVVRVEAAHGLAGTPTSHQKVIDIAVASLSGTGNERFRANSCAVLERTGPQVSRRAVEALVLAT